MSPHEVTVRHAPIETIIEISSEALDTTDAPAQVLVLLWLHRGRSNRRSTQPQLEGQVEALVQAARDLQAENRH